MLPHFIFSPGGAAPAEGGAIRACVHFQNPRNAGEVEAPDSTARLENPACGDILELCLRLEKTKLEGSRVAGIRFRAKGCVPAMACGSAITELVKGKKVEEARQVSREELGGVVVNTG